MQIDEGKLIKNEQNSFYLLFILILSVLAIVALAIETIFKLDQATLQILGIADTAVCVVFFIDFLIQLIRAENKILFYLGDSRSSVEYTDDQYSKMGKSDQNHTNIQSS
jgi:hypothetical protein